MSPRPPGPKLNPPPGRYTPSGKFAVLFRVRDQKPIAVLRTCNPLWCFPTPAPGGAGLRVPVLRRDRRPRGRRACAPATKELFGRDGVFSNLFANCRDDAVKLGTPHFFGLLQQCLCLCLQFLIGSHRWEWISFERKLLKERPIICASEVGFEIFPIQVNGIALEEMLKHHCDAANQPADPNEYAGSLIYAPDKMAKPRCDSNRDDSVAKHCEWAGTGYKNASWFRKNNLLSLRFPNHFT